MSKWILDRFVLSQDDSEKRQTKKSNWGQIFNFLIFCKCSCSGDELARNVREYAEQEKLNHTMQQALKDFSEKLSAVQDYRESEVNGYIFWLHYINF